MLTSIIKTLQLNVIFASLGFIWNVIILITFTTNIFNSQMIHGTVSLVAVTFFLLEHKQINTSSLPSRQQTLSLKVTIVKMAKKVYFHWNLLLIWLSYMINLRTLFQKKNSDPENVVNFKFYNIDQIQTLKFPDKHKFLA